MEVNIKIVDELGSIIQLVDMLDSLGRLKSMRVFANEENPDDSGTYTAYVTFTTVGSQLEDLPF